MKRKHQHSPVRWASLESLPAAGIAATLRMTGKAWEAAGATFGEVSDEQGERPRLAVGIATVEGVHTPFGVLDYRGQTTFLLVDESEIAEPDIRGRVLLALEAAGIVDLDRQLLDVARAQNEASGGRSTGMVKWFSETRGRGTILRDDGKPDLALSESDVDESGAIYPGTRVAFDIDDGDDGERRAEVVVNPLGPAGRRRRGLPAREPQPRPGGRG